MFKKKKLSTTNTSHKYSIFHVEVPAIPSLVSAVVIRQQLLHAVEWKTAHWDPISTCPAQAQRVQPTVIKLPQPHFPESELGPASPKLPKTHLCQSSRLLPNQRNETRTYKEHLNLYLRKKDVCRIFFFLW